MDDASLVDALAGGDGEAARELYRRHCRPILRFAVAMTNSVATAEDIVHDTFVELLYRPRNFDPARGSLRAFLYGIARHRIANAARRSASARPELPLEDEAQTSAVPDTEPLDLNVAAPAGTPEDQTQRAQELELLRAAIGSLPLVYREVIAWCDLEEVPYATVANIINCPIGTVRSRLHRARTLLAETLQSLRHQEQSRHEPDREAPSTTVALGSPLAASYRGGST
jgi:RNA polymerase sigma-70 factor (ECF subfamily)